MPQSKRERVKVMNGTISSTSGGLTKSDLKYNKRGRIVSKAKSHPISGTLGANEFYCVKCHGRVKVSPQDVRLAKARVTGQPMLKGWCQSCNSKVAKFVKA